MPSSQASKIQSGAAQINQNDKEHAIQKKAKELGVSYVNLVGIPVNPDMATLLTYEESQEANAVIFFKSGKRLKIAMLDPISTGGQALMIRLKSKGYDININLCSEESLISAQVIYESDRYIRKRQAIDNIVDEADLTSYAEEIKSLESLLQKIESSAYDIGLNYIQVGAYKAHASDVHFQPEENNVLVRFRIDGMLKAVFYLSRGIYEGIIKQIKYQAQLKLNITAVPQDGQYSFKINDRKINVRVSTMPSHYGEACVMRLLDAYKAFQSFEALGFTGEPLRHLREASGLSHGMILVTGPTGSGKTTTMYSLLQAIDSKSKKIITLEDPIEYYISGVTQSQVATEKGYTFSSGLRSILRQDPNVIMVGEVRDLETAETAAQASLTGHLVLTTLHTNSAVEALSRLVNMGVKSFIIAPALDLIIAQRLVRKICLTCTQKRPIAEAEKSYIDSVLNGIVAKGIVVPLVTNELYEAKGCEACVNTGFSGQMAIAEVLHFNQGLRDLVLAGALMGEIYKYAAEHNKMLTLQEDGVLKVLQGLTTLSEVYRVAS
jgi:type IV pilus assembly protein PilB